MEGSEDKLGPFSVSTVTSWNQKCFIQNVLADGSVLHPCLKGALLWGQLETKVVRERNSR